MVTYVPSQRDTQAGDVGLDDGRARPRTSRPAETRRGPLAGDILRLQRLAGNQAVCSLLSGLRSGSGGPAIPVQRSWLSGLADAAENRLEHAADAVGHGADAAAHRVEEVAPYVPVVGGVADFWSAARLNQLTPGVDRAVNAVEHAERSATARVAGAADNVPGLGYVAHRAQERVDAATGFVGGIARNTAEGVTGTAEQVAHPVDTATHVLDNAEHSGGLLGTGLRFYHHGARALLGQESPSQAFHNVDPLETGEDDMRYWGPAAHHIVDQHRRAAATGNIGDIADQAGQDVANLYSLVHGGGEPSAVGAFRAEEGAARETAALDRAARPHGGAVPTASPAAAAPHLEAPAGGLSDVEAPRVEAPAVDAPHLDAPGEQAPTAESPHLELPGAGHGVPLQPPIGPRPVLEMPVVDPAAAEASVRATEGAHNPVLEMPAVDPAVAQVSANRAAGVMHPAIEMPAVGGSPAEASANVAARANHVRQMPVIDPAQIGQRPPLWGAQRVGARPPNWVGEMPAVRAGPVGGGRASVLGPRTPEAPAGWEAHQVGRGPGATPRSGEAAVQPASAPAGEATTQPAASTRMPEEASRALNSEHVEPDPDSLIGRALAGARERGIPAWHRNGSVHGADGRELASLPPEHDALGSTHAPGESASQSAGAAQSPASAQSPAEAPSVAAPSSPEVSPTPAPTRSGPEPAPATEPAQTPEETSRQLNSLHVEPRRRSAMGQALAALRERGTPAWHRNGVIHGEGGGVLVQSPPRNPFEGGPQEQANFLGSLAAQVEDPAQQSALMDMANASAARAVPPDIQVTIDSLAEQGRDAEFIGGRSIRMPDGRIVEIPE